MLKNTFIPESLDRSRGLHDLFAPDLYGTQMRDAKGIIPAALGIGGLLLQNNANNSARRAAAAAQAQEQALLDRQSRLFDTQMGLVQDLDRQGAFNADKSIQQAEKESLHARGIAEGNQAAAARTLGYRPGDTAPIEGINQVDNESKNHLADLKLNLSRTAALDKINAYSSPNGGLLNTGVQAASNERAYDLSQVQSLAPILGSLMPFLSGHQTASAPSTGGGFKLGTFGTDAGSGNLGTGSNWMTTPPSITYKSPWDTDSRLKL